MKKELSDPKNFGSKWLDWPGTSSSSKALRRVIGASALLLISCASPRVVQDYSGLSVELSVFGKALLQDTCEGWRKFISENPMDTSLNTARSARSKLRPVCSDDYDQERFAAARANALQERNASLLRAASIGDTETVKRMLDSGAQIGVRDRYGDSPLHLAIKQKHPETAALLIGRGANVNQPNTLGDTPLHVSIYTRQQELAQQLRSKGASDNTLNQYGLNPNEMESLPETEAAVSAVAGLLSPSGNWIDARSARPRFEELKRREPKFLVNALVLQVIRSSGVRFQTIILSIKLGIQGSEGKIGAILMVFGDKGMAEDYLNSGSGTLHSWASKWVSERGYDIRTGPGSHRANWGSF